MVVRLVLAVSCIFVVLTPQQTESSAARAAAAPAERIVEHADVVDRVNWVLPPAKLAQFRSQGVVTEEETRSRLVGTGLVTAVTRIGASVRSDVTLTVHDVPRQITNVAHDHGTAVITSANTQVGSTRSSITVKEYHLPSLLPGTIAMSGSAWFDSVSGLIVQESYHVANTLVKTHGTERLGFVESLDADSDVHKEAPAASRTLSHAR